MPMALEALPANDAFWEKFDEDGFVNLGVVVPPEELRLLKQRIDDIMLGKISSEVTDKLLMQLDSVTGKYEDAGDQTLGLKGPTLGYRKIQNLENDPLFFKYMRNPIFKTFCRRAYGQGVAVGVFRAMFFNKPANQGTSLPWHQDRWRHLDRDPLVTVWTALDDSTVEKGCVQVIPGSHKRGVINPNHHSGYLTEEQIAEHCSEGIVNMELKEGEAFLMHNWLLHRSGVNTTSSPRRAFSVNYMDARTTADVPVEMIDGVDDKAKPANHGAKPIFQSIFPVVFEAEEMA